MPKLVLLNEWLANWLWGHKKVSASIDHSWMNTAVEKALGGEARSILCTSSQVTGGISRRIGPEWWGWEKAGVFELTENLAATDDLWSSILDTK